MNMKKEQKRVASESGMIRGLQLLLLILLPFLMSSCCGLRLHSEKVIGKPSAEIWFEESAFDATAIPALTVKDGVEYRMLLLADTQLDGAPGRVRKTLKLIETLVDSVKPDVIITLGDNVEWHYSDIMAKKLVKKYESFNIPYAITLGNHDSEGRKGRSWYGNLYESAPNSLFRYGPSNIHGVGNYSVLLRNEKGDIIYDLIMMDSNVRREYTDGRGYDFIHRDQIEWYKWNVKGVSNAKYGAYQAQEGKVVPSMCFFHIPLPEYADAINAIRSGEIDSTKIKGEVREGVASAKVNSGLFDVMKEMRSTTHVFVGHDHVNNLSVNWQGIQLSYGLKSGYTSYYSDDMIGGTIVTFKKNRDDEYIVNIEYLYVGKGSI